MRPALAEKPLEVLRGSVQSVRGHRVDVALVIGTRLIGAVGVLGPVREHRMERAIQECA